MPVYRRRIVSPAPSSLYSIETEDENDYLLDPDQLHDSLPQPYRMIGKILTHILDSVWEIVDTKDSILHAESEKLHAPEFKESQMLNLYQSATALASCADGKYIFIGLPNGLAVLDVATQTSLHCWTQSRTEVTSLKSYPFGSNYHIILAQDDMEQVRLFLFAYDTLYFIKTINENTPENPSKILCQKWDASSGGDYAGFVFQETSGMEVWFEVHRFPLESWLNDLDTIGRAFQEDLESSKSEYPDNSHVNEVTIASGSDGRTLQEKLGIKFGNSSPVLKVKPPPGLPLPASPWANMAAAIHKGNTGDVLGTGQNHVIGAVHLESLDAMFRYRHEETIQYLPCEKEEQIVSATFHFVNASRMLTNSLDPNIADTEPVAVIVWWTDSSYLSHYSLLRSGKDLELKPEMVWPFASNITCSALSPCMTYLTIGLANGNIVLWNRQLGLQKAVVNASHKAFVKSIQFLDSSIFPLDLPQYPPYHTMSATFFLAECSDGTQKLFDTCDGSQQIPRCIAEEPQDDDDIQTLLQTIPNLPELMMYIKKNGSMYIKEIGTGVDVCQIVLPPSYQIKTAWNPVFAFAENGDLLYLKGEGTEVDDAGTAENVSGIFLFDLRACSSLNTFRTQKQPKRTLAVYTTQEQRMNALLQERIQQQPLRKSRLQGRWGQLISELGIIQQAHKATFHVFSNYFQLNIHQNPQAPTYLSIIALSYAEL